MAKWNMWRNEPPNYFNLFHHFVMNHLRSKTIVNHEERLQLMLKSWKKQEYPSIREIAHQFNINHIILDRWINEDLSIVESREQQQLLSIAEEIAFYLYNTHLSRQEYYPKSIVIKKIVEELRLTYIEKLNVDEIQFIMYDSIDEEWMNRFIDQHSLLKRARV